MYPPQRFAAGSSLSQFEYGSHRKGAHWFNAHAVTVARRIKEIWATDSRSQMEYKDRGEERPADMISYAIEFMTDREAGDSRGRNPLVWSRGHGYFFQIIQRASNARSIIIFAFVASQRAAFLLAVTCIEFT